MPRPKAAQFVGGSLAPSDLITSMGWRDGVANFGTADASGLITQQVSWSGRWSRVPKADENQIQIQGADFQGDGL
ncbi:hypothetical protein LA080_000668 [Diaporthe eres]|nr:hypothetical protein LA080_000668 [Diaporthe eres]